MIRFQLFGFSDLGISSLFIVLLHWANYNILIEKSERYPHMKINEQSGISEAVKAVPLKGVMGSGREKGEDLSWWIYIILRMIRISRLP